MHVLHAVLVHDPFDSGPDAALASWSENYSEGSTWWDWYQVGGRWSGQWNGANTLNLAHDTQEAIAALEAVEDSRNAIWQQNCQELTGVKSDTDRTAWMLGLAPQEANVTATAFRETLIQPAPPRFTDTILIGSALQTVSQFMWEANFAQAMFTDTTYTFSVPAELLQDLRDGTLALPAPVEEFHLVAVDFHY